MLSQPHASSGYWPSLLHSKLGSGGGGVLCVLVTSLSLACWFTAVLICFDFYCFFFVINPRSDFMLEIFVLKYLWFTCYQLRYNFAYSILSKCCKPHYNSIITLFILYIYGDTLGCSYLVNILCNFLMIILLVLCQLKNPTNNLLEQITYALNASSLLILLL